LAEVVLRCLLAQRGNNWQLLTTSIWQAFKPLVGTQRGARIRSPIPRAVNLGTKSHEKSQKGEVQSLCFLWLPVVILGDVGLGVGESCPIKFRANEEASMSAEAVVEKGAGRDERGRFAARRINEGCRMVAMRSAFLEMVTPDDIREIVAALIEKAKAGSESAA